MSKCLHRLKGETEIAELRSQDQLLLLYQEIISTHKCAEGTRLSRNHQDTIFHAGYSREANWHCLRDPPVTNWIKIASQRFLTACKCTSLTPGGSQGEESAYIPKR